MQLFLVRVQSLKNQHVTSVLPVLVSPHITFENRLSQLCDRFEVKPLPEHIETVDDLDSNQLSLLALSKLHHFATFIKRWAI